VVIDGSENASVQFAPCCRPIPGDAILGYLGRGEGLVVHREECATAQRLRHKDSERFITVVWSEEPVRAFETGIVVTVRNGKGVLARVAQAITSAEGDISLVSMADQVSGQEATELRFVVSVEHAQHLQSVLASLRRVPAVVSAQRTLSGAG
jgi:GTP pyrophosphokinase